MDSVGADVYARGWVAVGLRDARFVRAWCAPALDELLAGVPVATTVGLDIPLGGVPEGWRAADASAKRLLGARHSSVFAVPPRLVWALPYDEAKEQTQRLTGVKVSRQAWGLSHRMLEAEAYRDTGPHALYEVHPELVFARLAGAPLAAGKKSWNGQMRRRALLAEVGLAVPDELPQAAGVPADDVLDAAAVAWCAHRISAGMAEAVPAPPREYDHRGRPIVIWF